MKSRGRPKCNKKEEEVEIKNEWVNDSVETNTSIGRGTLKKNVCFLEDNQKLNNKRVNKVENKTVKPKNNEKILASYSQD